MAAEVKPPILILIELLQGLFKQVVTTFNLLAEKLIELFISLNYISKLGLGGFFVAILFGSIVLFIIVKVSFGTSKTFFVVFLFYFILLILVYLSSSAQ